MNTELVQEIDATLESLRLLQMLYGENGETLTETLIRLPRGTPTPVYLNPRKPFSQNPSCSYALALLGWKEMPPCPQWNYRHAITSEGGVVRLSLPGIIRNLETLKVSQRPLEEAREALQYLKRLRDQSGEYGAEMPENGLVAEERTPSPMTIMEGHPFSSHPVCRTAFEILEWTELPICPARNYPHAIRKGGQIIPLTLTAIIQALEEYVSGMEQSKSGNPSQTPQVR